MTTIKIDKLRRFGFTNTTYVTGEFNKLVIRDKLLIKDSNFKFKTSSFTLTSLDDMFNGCENASFTHSLVISSDNLATTANRMFKNCYHASLPTVDIKNSNLVSCESMFENCINAKLRGVDFPKNVASTKSMFSGCKSSSFESIETLVVNNNNDIDYSETFKDCINGNFKYFKMPDIDYSHNANKTFNLSYMFYGCDNFNAGNLNLCGISKNISKSDYMFYEAGINGSMTFNNTVVNFSKLESCTSMFDSSNFELEKSYFNFTENNAITSLKRVFYNTGFVSNISPVIVLGGNDSFKDSIDDIESMIENPFNGNDKITDFTEAYAYSNLSIADLRGISNNLTTESSKISQNFTSMFEGCTKLTTIYGHIPSTGNSYNSMFKGCSSFKYDMSELFKHHVQSLDKNILVADGIGGNIFDAYSPTDISYMFDSCDKLYSSSDSFDLISIIKSTYKSLGEQEREKSKYYSHAFPKIKIATHDRIKELKLVDYNIDNISEKYGIVRYNSFEEEPYDNGDNSICEFGIYSKYARYAFGDGFYRFGGFFKDDPTKYFCVIEHPIKDYTTGNITTFYMDTLEYDPSIIPHDFSDKFETKNTSSTWNSFKFDKVYAAKIYNVSDNSLFGDYYVGSYTRIYNERKIIGGMKRVISKDYQMPVTYFILN